MQIPGAQQRAVQRLRESATPLYHYLVERGGNAIKPLGDGLSVLTKALVHAMQGVGRHGYLDVTVYEPPQNRADRNKFTEDGALNFTGAYPRHMLTAEGIRHFYGKHVRRARKS